MFELNAPLVVLDVETTGPHRKVDRVIQIGLIKLYPDGQRSEYQTYLNPMTPIPPESTEIHHITDEMVASAPRFAEVAPQLAAGFRGCDFAGYSVNFDLGFLEEEFRRVTTQKIINGRVIDAFAIYRRYHPRTLTDAVAEYLKEKMEGAHDAMNDVRATLRVLEAQLDRHPDLPRTVEELHRDFNETPQSGWVDSEGRFYWRHGHACFNFGQNAGKRLEDTEPRYLRWMLANDFSDEVKGICRSALTRKYPERQVGSPS